MPEPTVKGLEIVLNRLHTNFFPDTKRLTGKEKGVAQGKCNMIEYTLWWIDAVRRGEVIEEEEGSDG